ncbi:MAG: helix-turn-helix transcriptional regulator [Bacteroidaceae bacterium]|nr:helix-turn-helix transcriptional regulator [Bacteroidaceae bacterium]
MLMTVIAFIPFMTCLFWLVLNPLVHKQDKSFRTLELLLAITGIVSFTQAGLSCSEGKAMLSFFLIKQFFAPLLVPAALLYVSHLTQDRKWKPFLQAWIIIPVSLLFAESILIMLSGTDGFIDSINKTPAGGVYDKTVNLIHFCSFWVFYIVLAVQVLFWIISAIIKATKGKNHIQLYSCTALILAIATLEISVITDGMPQWIAAIVFIILSCTIFYISYAETFKCTICSTNLPEKEAVHDNGQQHHESVTIIADAHQSMADEENLRIRFEDLIVTEQLFLKQGIRISDIASMLETNRTYVSRLVNNTYNMSFSDYMNTLRIDYAEQYLMHHKDAKQSDIAEACGFPNASAFNNVFKKITGVTPKIWLATRS